MAKKRKKRTGKKQNSVIPILCLLAAAAAAVVLGIVFLSGNSYSSTYLGPEECFGITSPDEAAVLIDGRLQEEKALYEDGQIYLPYDLACRLPGNAFYYENSSQTLYLTLPSGNYTWQDGSGVLKLSGENALIDVETIRQYSDAELSVYTDPARVVIRSEWKDIVFAEASEDTQMRSDPNRKGSITADVPAGTVLTDLGEEKKGWSLVSQEDGYFGYIETEKLIVGEPQESAHEQNPLTVFKKNHMDKTIKMVWHYVDVQENNDILDYMLEDTGSINVICPTWITIKNKNGEIDSLADENYVRNIRNRGVRIWTMVSDYLGGDASTGEILMEHDSRIRLEEEILRVAWEYGLDGINIDFETITEEQAPAFLQFLRELSVQTHSMGLILSVDNFVPHYTGYYDRTSQAKIVDYIIIMGYDEHTEYSPEPGSVASLPFVKEGIEKTMEEVPAEQIILGVPFYTRSWTQPFGTDYFETEALAMPGAQEFVREKEIQLSWDEELGQDFGQTKDDSAVYSIWMENARSLEKKLELVNTYGLAGASAWRLGLESADVWEGWNSILK